MNTLRKSMNIMVLISDNIEKLKLVEYQGVMETPHGDKTVDGFITNLLSVSKTNLEIFFIYKHNGISAYDEDNNRLYLSMLPESGNPKQDLINEVKNNIQECDILIHELTHYFDWIEGTIQKFDFKTYKEYFNSTPEINAYINQGVYKALLENDDYPTIDNVVAELGQGFVQHLTTTNKKLVKEQVVDVLLTFKDKE